MAVVGDESGSNKAGAPSSDPVDAPDKSLLKRILHEVRRWPRAIVGMIVAGIIAVLVGLVWTHFSGSEAKGFPGFILGPSGTAVRQGPTVSSATVGNLAANTGVVVVCTRTGDPVVGPNLNIQSRAQFESSQQSSINQLLGLIYVLLALAVVIALIGIVNTLLLSVFERTREIGLLRAVGMKRRQVREMIRSESVIVALFGAPGSRSAPDLASRRPRHCATTA